MQTDNESGGRLMVYNVFLAWQSENNTTQKFDQKALEKATKILKKKGVEIKPIIRPAEGEADLLILMS